MTLGRMIKEGREANGLTQEELAEKLAVTRQTIAGWESSRVTPRPHYQKRLAETIGLRSGHFQLSENIGQLKSVENKRIPLHWLGVAAILGFLIFMGSAAVPATAKSLGPFNLFHQPVLTGDSQYHAGLDAKLAHK